MYPALLRMPSFPTSCAAHAGLLLPHGGGTPALPPSSDGNSSEAVAAQSVARKVNPRPATGGPAQTANDSCRETRAPLRLCPSRCRMTWRVATAADGVEG